MRETRILFADDDLDLLRLVEHCGGTPDTIITNSGGLTALRSLDALNYEVDAAILDLSMPDRDGVSVTQDIRREESIRSKAHPMRIFWLTGVDVVNDPTLMDAKEKYHVQEVFIKPVFPELIIERVKQSLLEEPR